MRVGFYNQMFGLNGKSFLQNLVGHWAVHFQGNKEKVWKRVNLDKTFELVAKSNSDILGIAEILEGQEEKIKNRLHSLGYKYVFFAEGHKTKFSKLFVKIAIASKFECKQALVSGFPLEDEMGGGGGFIHCKFKDFDFVSLHLASSYKRVFQRQIRFVKSYLSKLNGKVILMGDFNLSYRKFQKVFVDFNLSSGEMKTCSNTRLIGKFVNLDLDHIFVKGFTFFDRNSLDGFSDHRMIYVDLN